jgi:hypothetical protein
MSSHHFSSNFHVDGSTLWSLQMGVHVINVVIVDFTQAYLASQITISHEVVMMIMA